MVISKSVMKQWDSINCSFAQTELTENGGSENKQTFVKSLLSPGKAWNKIDKREMFDYIEFNLNKFHRFCRQKGCIHANILYA